MVERIQLDTARRVPYICRRTRRGTGDTPHIRFRTVVDDEPPLRYSIVCACCSETFDVRDGYVKVVRPVAEYPRGYTRSRRLDGGFICWHCTVYFAREAGLNAMFHILLAARPDEQASAVADVV